ncbi:MAG: hypothetical protein HFK08_01720 [Clostridia bacterium]|nr:hypothetical protein [Clostridia bacterium]
MIKPNEDYRKIAHEFYKKFGYGIQLRKIPTNESLENLIYNIQHCVDTGVDDLVLKYPALAVSTNDDILT